MLENDITIFVRLISALGVRPVRVSNLGEPYRLYVRSQTALVDTDADAADWDRLYGTVLAAIPDMVS